MIIALNLYTDTYLIHHTYIITIYYLLHYDPAFHVRREISTLVICTYV